MSATHRSSISHHKGSGQQLIVFFCVYQLCASPANAHAPVPGIEGFYIGLIDPLFAAPQLLLLTTLGFLIAGFENREVIGLLPAYLLATLVGIVFGAGVSQAGGALLGAAIVCGAAAAAAPGRFLFLAIVAAIAAGFLIGAVSIPGPGPVRDRIITVSGSFVGANLGLLYIVGAVLFIKDRFPYDRTYAALRTVAAVAGVVVIVLLTF